MDDQRTGLLGPMPATRKWMRRGGTTYRNAVTPDPLCCPARASLFTGRYIHNHKLTRAGLVDKLDHSTTLQRYLSNAGYHTGLVGKYFIRWPLSKKPPHFDRWSVGRIGVGHRRKNYYGARWNLDGVVRKVHAYSTDFVRRRSIGLLKGIEKRSDKEPWLLYVAPTAPHEPMVSAPRHRDARVSRWRPSPAVSETDRSDKPPWVRSKHVTSEWGREARRKQIRALMSANDLVDSLMRWLKRNGELQNTLVFFTSDNGFLWGDHGLRRKRYPYTHSIEVPLLIRWPGRFPKDRVRNQLVSLVDIAPTVLDAVGLKARRDEPMDGRSLLAAHDRSHSLIEFSGSVEVGPWASLRSKTMQFVEYYDQQSVIFREYYNLRRDPWQLRNLLEDGDPKSGPDVEALSRKLERARRCGGSNCP